MDSPASGPRFRWHLLGTRLGFSTRNIRRVFVPIVLLAALLTLSGCVKIIGHTIPTNVELKASDIYTMKLRVQPTNDVTGDYRMTLALRLPDVLGTINPFRVHSVTYAGAVSGSFVRSSVMDSDEFWASVMELYFTMDWQLKPIDAKHNGHGDGNGSWWVGYSSGSAKGVKATQWVDITIEVVNHQGVADGLIDIVTGATSWAYPEDKGRNGDGELWEAGDVLLNQPVKLVKTVPYVFSTYPIQGGVNVAHSVSPTVRFSESMSKNTLVGNIFLRRFRGLMVPSLTVYDSPTNTFTINPTADLAPGTMYEIVVKAGVEDLAGNPMSADHEVFFTTAAAATAGPQVIQQFPLPGATGVSTGSSVSAAFDQDMDASTITGGVFSLGRTGSATQVPAVVTYLANVAGLKRAVINPNSDLEPGAEYTVSLRSGVKGNNGLGLQGTPITWTFTTAGAAPVAPQVIEKTPASGAIGVPVGSSVSAGFDQDMNAATITNTSFTLKKSGSATVVPATVTYVGGTETAVLDPTSDLEPSTLYNVTLTSAVLGTNTLAVQGAPVTWSFTTAAPVLVAPQVIEKTPASGATGVSVGSSISAGFDQDMNAASLTNASFTLKKSGSATVVPATVTYVGATETAVLDPTSDLEPSTLYNVTLTSAVLGTNTLAVQGAPVTWSFTTAAPVASGFPDVPGSHPFFSAIQGMADLGIINGYADGTFGPGDPVRRWQFAKMIDGSLSLPIFESDTSPFTDLDADDLLAIDMNEYVAVAFKNGITNGATATTFGPYMYISRTQVVTMVVRAVQGTTPSALATPTPGYTNAWGTGYSSTHGPPARIAEYNGLLAGIDLAGVANDPYSRMPRGEVAQILWNMMDLLGLR